MDVYVFDSGFLTRDEHEKALSFCLFVFVSHQLCSHVSCFLFFFPIAVALAYVGFPLCCCCLFWGAKPSWGWMCTRVDVMFCNVCFQFFSRTVFPQCARVVLLSVFSGTFCVAWVLLIPEGSRSLSLTPSPVVSDLWCRGSNHSIPYHSIPNHYSPFQSVKLYYIGISNHSHLFHFHGIPRTRLRLGSFYSTFNVNHISIRAWTEGRIPARKLRASRPGSTSSSSH